ncbi:MAG: hypothetical protein RIG82_04440 [Phycisphaeraceae bacterium]
MPQGEDNLEVVIWCDKARQGLVGEVIGELGRVSVLGVGGPVSSPPAELAERLKVAVGRDLRKLVIDQPARVALLAVEKAPGVEQVAEAADRCDLVLTTDLLAEGLDAAAALRDELGERLGRVILAPRFSEGPGMLGANEPWEVLGEPRLAVIEFDAPAETTRLVTSLYHAWLSALEALPMPDEVHASLVHGRYEPGKVLSGSLAISGRSPGRGAGLLAVSDQTGRWDRRLRLTGPEGSLVVTDEGYTLHNDSGVVIDELPGPKAGASQAVLIARSLLRALDQSTYPHEQEPTAQRVLACCEATLLSLRTGQAENPGKLLNLGMPL